MAYKRVRGQTLGQSLPMLNFVKYPPPTPLPGLGLTSSLCLDYVSRGSSTCCLRIMSQDELHVHVPTIKSSTDIMDWGNLIHFLHLRNFRVQLQGKQVQLTVKIQHARNFYEIKNDHKDIFVKCSHNSIHFPLKSLRSHIVDTALYPWTGSKGRNSSIFQSSAAIVIFMTLHVKIRELSLSYYQVFPFLSYKSISRSQRSMFWIVNIWVFVFRHQTFSRPQQSLVLIFNRFLDHSDRESQSAIDNLNHSNR